MYQVIIDVNVSSVLTAIVQDIKKCTFVLFHLTDAKERAVYSRLPVQNTEPSTNTDPQYHTEAEGNAPRNQDSQSEPSHVCKGDQIKKFSTDKELWLYENKFMKE